MKKDSLGFGEVFICTNSTKGALQVLPIFNGKNITSLGGGFNKLFVMEDSTEKEGVVSTLHSPEFDEYDYTFSDSQEEALPFDLLSTFDNKDDGRIFSYGIGEYGALGVGGLEKSFEPLLLKSISNRIIEQIACGEFHTLALSSLGDIYSWGRGFEGQLGIVYNVGGGKKKEIQALSTPKYIPYFDKIKIQQVTAGAYHSAVITENGELYVWGEARMGQIGTGKKTKEIEPCLINLREQLDLENERLSEISRVKIKMAAQGLALPDKLKVISASAGYGHTAVITEQGEVFTWGLNTKGQLGNGNREPRYFPCRLTRDILNNPLPMFKSIKCGYSATYAIDEFGKLFSWGGGNLGQKEGECQDLPRSVDAHTEDRIFTNIFANKHSFIAFAKTRVMSIRPNCGPSTGGTLMSILGTGIYETPHQGIRFEYSKYKVDVECSYDPNTCCFSCITPHFDNVTQENIEWPQSCKIKITLDGETYYDCEKSFLIYCNLSFNIASKIMVNTIFPRCASILGRTELTLNISNITKETSDFLENITVGFQAKDPKTINTVMSKSFSAKKLTDPDQIENSKKEMQINPLTIQEEDPELDKPDWICMIGRIENNKIMCNVPEIDENSDNLLFNVDISLNGQQFSGQPSSFKFYDIQITDFNPKNSMAEGGAMIKIHGNGFFDTVHKKIKIISDFGERLIDVTWDKVEKFYSFITPPITWFHDFLTKAL